MQSDSLCKRNFRIISIFLSVYTFSLFSFSKFHFRRKREIRPSEKSVLHALSDAIYRVSINASNILLRTSDTR